MELIETRTGLTVIFILALALFFLRQYAHNPFKQTLQKASQGDPEAQYQMGLMYYQGKKVPQDYGQAFNWLDTAAKNGHTRAMTALAGLYNAGHGCPQNFGKTFHWYKTAAEAGDFEGRVNLAICYLHGIGTQKDEKKGFELMKAAAEDKRDLHDLHTAFQSAL